MDPTLVACLYPCCVGPACLHPTLRGDRDAVHGMHATYSVSKLGTARSRYAATPHAPRLRETLDLSVPHAAWDTDAVHGMHAAYSVSKLGTARSRCRTPPHPDS